MTRRVRVVLALVLLGTLGAGAPTSTPNTAPDPRAMTFPATPFEPPRAERVVLPNGIILYLLEDHELPMVSLSAMIRTGSIYEPADKLGLASLTGTVMRTGGTVSRSGDELDEELEFVGAEMGAGIGGDAGSASLNVLTKDVARGVALFAEMLVHPAFAPEKLDLAKKQAIEGIRRRNDSPGSIASREFNKLLYGPDHPYARESTEATINAITRDDVVAFHRRYVHPNTTMIAATGDFNRAEFVALLTKTFEAWKRERVTWPAVLPVRDQPVAPVNYVRREVSQTQVRMGHLAITQADPDFFAFSLLDDILGGQAFSSRLFQEVRTKSGLAYSVGSALIAGRFDRGTFLLYAQTKAGSTAQAISAMRAEFDRVRTTPVSRKELDDAKQAFLNSFVFSFSSPAQIVNRQMSLEYYGLPADFLERFRANVEKVTTKDLARVAQKHLRPDKMTILAVGDERTFDKPLSTFGPVRTISLDQPTASLQPAGR
ncbi:MAG: insulinase family protein [Nitrospirae bacterium]|nr:insulinase family protein [Nitrospirota bacterium]